MFGLSWDKQNDLPTQKQLMMERHLRGRGIGDEAVLRAMETVPREEFISQEHIGSTYKDNPLPIGFGQTISQPYIVALMLEKLSIGSDDKVLEIGCGCGYQAAVIGQIANQIYSVEIIDELASGAKSRFENLGYDNIHLKVGDGSLGWSENAPFDKIITAATAVSVPKSLVDQLAEGGKIILPIGDALYQELVFGEKVKRKINYTHLNSVRFVPMVGEAEKL